MIVMNKYCKSKWDSSWRISRTIRASKYKRLERLENTSNSVGTDTQEKSK